MSSFANGSNVTDATNLFQVGDDISDTMFAQCGIILPVVFIFGYMGNILTAIVLWKKDTASTNNSLLCALVLTDMAIITTIVMSLSLPILFSRLLDYDLVINVIYSQGYTVSNYLAMTSQQCNEYVLVSISVERYFAVCHPLKYVHYRSRGKTIALICGIICCSVVYNIPRLFATTVQPTTCVDLNSSFTCYELLYTEFGNGYFYQDVYKVWLYGATYFVVPLTILLIMNIFIIKELAKMRTIRQNLGVVNSPNAKKDSITLSLVIIMLLFGVVQTLGFFNQFPNVPGDAIDQPTFTATVNTLYGINSSINILIYAFVGRIFRKNVLVLFKTCFHCVPLCTSSSEHYQVT